MFFSSDVSPQVRCSPGCHRRCVLTSLHTCSLCTCQSPLSWCGLRSPASHCPTSDPCSTHSFVRIQITPLVTSHHPLFLPEVKNTTICIIYKILTADMLDLPWSECSCVFFFSHHFIDLLVGFTHFFLLSLSCCLSFKVLFSYIQSFKLWLM